MAFKTFHLSIVTPGRVIFDGNASYLSVPGSDGYMGLLVDHAPIISPLKAGVFQVRTPGSSQMLTFTTHHSGLFEFNQNHASVLLQAEDSNVLDPV